MADVMCDRGHLLAPFYWGNQCPICGRDAEIERLREELADLKSRYDHLWENRKGNVKRAERSEARNATLEAAIRWALGEGDSDFGDHLDGTEPRYWWRKELLKRAGLRCGTIRSEEG